MDNLLAAIIAGLLIIAIFMWNNPSKKETETETETQATPQVEKEPTKVQKPAAEPKKKKGSKKKRRKKKNKKKGKQQQEAKATPQEAAPPEETKEPEANDSNKKPKQRKKKKGSSKTANGGTKQQKPDDGGGWVTAGKKKKKKQPRGGYDANAAKAGQSSTYAVVAKKIGIIIGPKGTTLRAIEARSGCKIQLPETRNDSRKEVTVTLTGSSQERQLGKTIIKELVELGFSPKLKPGMKMHTVSVSVSLLPVLRGNKFAALKALEEDGNVKMSIPEKISGSAKSVRVKVAGATRGIEKTKKSLTQLNLYYHSEATHPGYVHKELYNCNLPLLVGPRGQTIKSIQGDTKAKVYTPNSASANQNVVLVGTKAQVVKALAQVQRVLSVDLKTLTTKPAPRSMDDDFYMEEDDGGEDL
jgi:hypothetical protein